VDAAKPAAVTLDDIHKQGTGKIAVKRGGFALFDFFANCEYFWEDIDCDVKLRLPQEVGGRDEIGLFGMRIDREKYRDRFEQQAGEAVSADVLLRQAFEDEDWPAVEERVRQLLFEKPDEREALIGYLRLNVPLGDFEQVA
jgi:type I restriction enzyme, R subunit